MTCFTSTYCLFCDRRLSSIYSPIRPCFILTLLFRSPSSILRLVPFDFSYKFCIACYDFCTLKSPISKNKSTIYRAYPTVFPQGNPQQPGNNSVLALEPVVWFLDLCVYDIIIKAQSVPTKET